MTPKNRRSYTAELMALAAESMEEAEKSLAVGMYKVAVSRSYYAMFRAASALLAARDIHRHRHGGVISAFGEQFCKTSDIEPRFGTILRKAYDLRIDCDYEVGRKQGRKATEAAVERAREFLHAAEERLKAEFEETEDEPRASK